ncbi:class I SAM-dependent methyltransferase [Salaquimonas pukyongi]|uniref:class I SAM-dependent methyltransferase n=1 Tax=Salaquimonas pukyongi TaxID=2712698 RepID=UPI00096B91A7|nr:class I SAM-dependent methyltransferase [Salaquimonas pukyongi]
MGILDEIGLRKGTDKSSIGHGYLDIYEEYLERYRNLQINILEIGVFNGNSVSMWKEYFPHANIIGVDYDPRCTEYEESRIKIVIGNASDEKMLIDIVEENGAPTVVVDDGSHRWDHQILAMKTLLPRMAKGGTYICEDIDTSFEGQLAQAPFDGGSEIRTFDYLCEISKVMVAGSAIGSEPVHDEFVREAGSMIRSVTFIPKSCILQLN